MLQIGPFYFLLDFFMTAQANDHQHKWLDTQMYEIFCCVWCVWCGAPDWTFVLLPSLSPLSTPRLIQLLFLPVPGQAFTGQNISITNVKNAWMHYTLALVNILLVITLVTNVRESQDLLTPVLACFSCRFLSLENAFASCGLTSLCNHTGHNCEELSGAFLLQSWLISPVTCHRLSFEN